MTRKVTLLVAGLAMLAQGCQTSKQERRRSIELGGGVTAGEHGLSYNFTMKIVPYASPQTPTVPAVAQLPKPEEPKKPVEPPKEGQPPAAPGAAPTAPGKSPAITIAPVITVNEKTEGKGTAPPAAAAAQAPSKHR